MSSAARLFPLLLLMLWSCSPEIFIPEKDTFLLFEQILHSRDSVNDQRYQQVSMELPQDPFAYELIEMSLSLNCPEGECSPMTSFGNICLIGPDDTLELARFITPYGISCNWRLDVTDYAQRLRGNIKLLSFIDTPTNEAWKLTASLDYIKGTPSNDSIAIFNIWRDMYLPYGDPAKPSIQPQGLIKVPENARSVKLKVINTGHGRGNSLGAGDYYKATHSIWVNDTKAADHSPWRQDCSQNILCSQQQGDWESPRAGWCPGSTVPAQDFDITSLIRKGAFNEILYRFEDYTNTCRPDAADCNCDQCEYDGMNHIEAHHRISLQLAYYFDR